MTTKTFSVNGMKCGHCKANVEQAILALDGVSRAEANLEAKSGTVEFDENSPSGTCVFESVTSMLLVGVTIVTSLSN